MTRAVAFGPRRRFAVEIGVDGYALLTTPLFNKGMAFPAVERDLFGLNGMLPSHIGTIEDQSTRRLRALDMFEKNIEKYFFLRDLQDTNETLFYAVLTANLEKMLPLVYTPTPLVPDTQELRAVAAAVALDVAQQAQKEGLAAPLGAGALDRRIREMMWVPAYRPYRRVAEGATPDGHPL